MDMVSCLRMESRYFGRSPCKYFTRRFAALLIELEAQIL